MAAVKPLPLLRQVATAPALNVTLTTLPPRIASALLNQVHPSAKPQQDVIQAYAQVMRDGDWVMNGTPIIVSDSGQVLDGVQRLSACIESGIPLCTYLVQGVSDESFYTIDQHRRRSLAGALKYRGLPHHQLLAGLISWLERYEARDVLGEMPCFASWARLERILCSSPAFREAAEASLACPTPALPELVRAIILFMGNSTDRAATHRLLDALQHPERYALSEPGVMLNDCLERERDASMARIMALSIKALNATRRGQQLQRLSWMDRPSGRRAAEPFPLLEGYPGLPDAGAAAPVEEEQLSCQVEVIDAATASRYLQASRPTRQVSAAHVQALASDIALGRWITNGQPICFSATGQLLDGQHRLQAVVAAKSSIGVVVVRGLPAEAYATYDSHQKRSAAADDPQTGFGDQALATAMANLLWRYERRTDGVRYKRASATEVREILTQHPRLVALRGFARRMVPFGRSSVMGYGAYVIERENAEMGRIFLDGLVTGADLPAGHPILLLRSNLQRLRRENASQAEQLSALLTGWRRYKLHPAAERDRQRMAARPAMNRA